MLPRFENMDPETCALVESHLPASVKEMARLVGLEAALLIVHKFGGKEKAFCVKSGVALDELCDVIGKEKAELFSNEYPEVDMVYIPLCRKAMNALRDWQIVALFQESIACKSVRETCNDIAENFGMSYRAVEMIVNAKRKRA